MAYNPKYFHSGHLHSLNPKKDSLWHHVCSDGTIIGFFQGNRGLFPELDFQIKLLLDGVEQRMFTPKHWDWAVDLIIKSHFFPQEVSEILDFYINFYENECVPFDSPRNRDTHTLITVSNILDRYGYVNVPRTLAIDAVATLLELFSFCEKRNLPIAHQFVDALKRMKDYCIGEADLKDVLNLTCSHY